MKSIDPDSLLAEGTSTLRYIGLSFPRDKGICPGIGDHSPMTATEYLSTDIDFLDIHSYQMESELLGAKDNVAADISSMLMDTPECIRLMREKPVVMCEYGSFKNMQQSFDEAKEFILGQRNAALENGFKGVMFWSFDSFSQIELYSAIRMQTCRLYRLDRRLYQKAVLRLCRYCIDNSRELKSLGYLYRLLKFDPYSEEAYLLLFEAYARQKDHASAKRLYANYLEVAKELDIKPSEGITRLYREAVDISRV